MSQKTDILNVRFFVLVSLALLMASLTFSVYMMSVSQFLMAGFWLIDGMELRFSNTESLSHYRWQRFFKNASSFFSALFRNFLHKIALFFRNKPALIFASIFLMHVLGVIHSTDLGYALKDLRTKMPLILLPLFLGTTAALSRKELKILLLIYVGAITINTFISTWIYLTQQVTDPREISIYISHIRFSLNICLAIFALIYLIHSDKTIHPRVKIVLGSLAVWLFVFLFLLKSLSGIMSLVAVTLILSLYFMLKIKSLALKLLLFLSLLLVPVYLVFFTYSALRSYSTPEPILFDTLATHTALGNPYIHDTATLCIENGRYVGLYLSWDELQEAWNQHSTIDFMGLDAKNQEIRFTLVRYLSSKNLRKDASGISNLSPKDINNIELGVANIEYLKPLSLKIKIYEAASGFINMGLTGNPNANSFLQRIEYWKASWWLIQKNPIVGVGTGDMNIAFRQAYIEMDSPLLEQWRWRSHNQYLSICVGFGVIGMLWFLFAMFYPAWRLKGHKNFLFVVFFIIALSSMLVEDTIETQAGVTFFALFYALFLLIETDETNTRQPAEQDL